MDTKPKHIFRVEIDIKHRDEIPRLLAGIQPEELVRKAKQKEEMIIAIAFIPEEKIEWLKNNNFSYRVIEDATEKGLQRQKEVGKGNRYEKPDVVPHGIGKKIK